MNEADLLKALNDHLEGKGLKVFEEVPFNYKRIDVVASSCNGEVYAFELKLNKWREAISQASLHRPWSDLVYIVMPSHTAHRAMAEYEYLQSLGIGLLEIDLDDASVNALIEPRENQTRTHLRQKMMTRLEEISRTSGASNA